MQLNDLLISMLADSTQTDLASLIDVRVVSCCSRVIRAASSLEPTAVSSILQEIRSGGRVAVREAVHGTLGNSASTDLTSSILVGMASADYANLLSVTGQLAAADDPPDGGDAFLPAAQLLVRLASRSSPRRSTRLASTAVRTRTDADGPRVSLYPPAVRSQSLTWAGQCDLSVSPV